MDSSTSALIVAVVGVIGTLMSGLLAHRSALRAKSVELEHAEQRRQEEQLALERRQSLSERRAAYAVLNRRLRTFHAVLWRHRLALAAGEVDPQQKEEREEARRLLQDEYAEAQMVISDGVLAVGGSVVHRLHRIHKLLEQHEQGLAAEESLEEIGERLERASEGLYEVRQVMRRDLGISDAPVQRPEGYGTT